MGQALYRKYRSKSLSEIVGQDHIITTLKNALKQGNISHAYLFTGPRGVGKTSIARILAHEINELPYNEETVHIDIIEIDAASNRRIDEIRDLRDKVHIAPSSAKYKVYIIDEVHMLTREAFNALLKTLEEPPAHAIFILATTEVHKLPETIVSRTQRFSFRPIENTKAVAHLRTIATEEKITISDEALELIADHGDGSFRDSISLLDQISTSGGPIDVDDIRTMLGVAPQAAIEELYKLTQTGTPQTILEYLTSLQEQGYEAAHIAKQLSGVLRQQLVSGSTSSTGATNLLKQLIEVPASSDPTTRLEITLLEANLKQNPEGSSPARSTPQDTTSDKPKATAVAAPPKVEEPVTKPRAKAKEAPVAPQADNFDEAWNRTLSLVKSKYNTLYGVLRMATARQEGEKVILVCKFAFHQKRLADTKNRAIIGDILYEQLGTPLEITCIVEKDAKIEPVKLVESAEPTPKPALDTISNIFGATEVLES